MLRGKEDQILRDIASQTTKDDKRYPEDDEEFERYLAGIKSSQSGKSGQLIDLFGGNDDDEDYIGEHKDQGEMYGDPTGIGLPYGDDIFEEDLLEEEDDADAERNRELDRQDDLRAQTAGANSSGGATNNMVKAAQANDTRQGMRGATAAETEDDGMDF